MASFNKIILIGNLTRDPELRYLPSGKGVCTLRLAASERYKTSAGEPKEETLFIDAVIFGKQAETASTYLKKGRPVLVEGRLRVRDFEGRDGAKRRAVEIIANRWQFIGPREGGASGGGVPAEVPPAGGGAEPVDEPMPSFEEEA
ncbi:MAG: single-stranded DNA-binding protein [Candidatus Coatesbacteria bacterium]